MTLPQGTHRIVLTIQYDGTEYHGWQIQRVQRTVQGELESAIERLTGQRRLVVGSGRTDTGVHALGQVAAVDVPSRWDPVELEGALNAVLPGDIWIAEARVGHQGFHPRFDAVARTYLYRVGLAPLSASPFHRPWCWPVRSPLDEQLLKEGAALLAGEHSFRAFAKTGQPERGERCTVQRAGWTPWEELGLAFEITADRYLRHMVRYLIGTLVDVARGRRPLDDMKTLLSDDGHGQITSPPAPPEGLFLALVEYPSASRALADPPTDSQEPIAR